MVPAGTLCSRVLSILSSTTLHLAGGHLEVQLMLEARIHLQLTYRSRNEWEGWA